MFWGDRFAKVTDPFGHSWSLATHIEDVTPEGEDYPGHLYAADLVLPQATTARSITITPTNPEVLRGPHLRLH